MVSLCQEEASASVSRSKGALVVSVVLEGYRPGLLALTGAVLAIAGNALALGWKLNFALPFRKPPT